MREAQATSTVQQLALMTATLGARELEHFFHLREQEFELLSSAINLCDKESHPFEETVTSALRLTSGLSAIISSGPDGLVTHVQLSSNHSNRHVLQKNIKGQYILPEAELDDLFHRYQTWTAKQSTYTNQQVALLTDEAELKARGENNSERYRHVQRKLLDVRERLKSPYTQVILGGASQAVSLGLPFNMDTYIFSRPILNCDSGNLEGYYSAFMDRTLLEDFVYSLKEELLSNGIVLSEIALINERSGEFLTQSSTLNPELLKTLTPELSDSVNVRQDIEGIALRLPIETSRTLITKTHDHINNRLHNPEELAKSDPKSGISLLMYIPAAELQRRCDQILAEVVIWASVIALVFTLLIFLLAQSIAGPIIHLTEQAESLARGQHRHKSVKSRNDEIGRLLHTFENMAATIKTKENDLFEQATHDTLTGCANRRALFTYAAEEKRLAEQSGGSLFVFMLDLDHFKNVNDLYGHKTGDYVLLEFAQTVRKLLRTEDKFCRIGGEEFSLLIAETDLSSARIIAERIRQRVEDLILTDPQNNEFKITVSIGLSEWLPTESFDQALLHSDERLYTAKRAGRNRVIS
ncbi:sensor domain-containing diguanylate cyclase [Amphritea japonica]|uniref:sensor domain-containing diguanylate cyclase n=1 Tax=Amphritea japonica TaxID=452627 RepID=UPI001469B39D|nr:sensor domain-containing diguanylate cyclase [Amphritea japonica]